MYYTVQAILVHGVSPHMEIGPNARAPVPATSKSLGMLSLAYPNSGKSKQQASRIVKLNLQALQPPEYFPRLDN